MKVETLTDYYNILKDYRDEIEKKVVKGKLDIDKGYELVDKLNEWYTIAKLRMSTTPKKKEGKKNNEA